MCTFTFFAYVIHMLCTHSLSVIIQRYFFKVRINCNLMICVLFIFIDILFLRNSQHVYEIQIG